MDFETSKRVNPFLMDDLPDYASPIQSNEASSNPFLTADFTTEHTGTDNPFLTENFAESFNNLPDTNPFANFAAAAAPNESNENQTESWQQPPQEPAAYTQEYQVNLQEMMNTQKPLKTEKAESRPNELGLCTTAEPIISDFLLSSDEEAKPKRPPPPHNAMPKETQDLILSVTGALEATSHHLLDRLPPTRAPSPTAFPDFQSLVSPTPDTISDLLGTTHTETNPSSLPPFLGNNEVSEHTKPEKPPPPKFPPPRPVPPKPVPPTAQPSKPPQAQEDDMFDLFGTMKPPMSSAPKTKDAILNLYSQPKQPPKDLLTDDFEMEKSGSSFFDNGIKCQEVEDLLSSDAPVPLSLENEETVTVTKLENKDVLNDFSVPVFAPQEPTPNETYMTSTQQNVLNDREGENIYLDQTTALKETPKPEIKEEPQNVLGSVRAPEPEFFGATAQPIFNASPPYQEEPQLPVLNSVPQTEKESKKMCFTDSTDSFDAFDAFTAKFENTGTGPNIVDEKLFDPFSGTGKTESNAWDAAKNSELSHEGFGAEDSFDAFLSLTQPPVSQSTPNKLHKTDSAESDGGGFNIFIKPKTSDAESLIGGIAPILAPPPSAIASNLPDGSPRFNPFDKGDLPVCSATEGIQISTTKKRSESQETPPTPLFDDDISQPLEEFPRIHYAGEGWEMQLRQPNKKKITGQRFWKKIFVKLVYQGDNPVLQLYNLKEDKDPFQELPLQACYSVSDISAQQYDQFGKIFTVKLQYIFYKERPGVRPGQVTKAERITNKLSQFAAYAIQGDYQGVKEFGSDLRKLGLPVEHAPQISQLLKLGCMSYEDLKQFSVTVEECLFRMPVHRDRALNYKMEEVQITVVDEIYVEQTALGHVEKQIARVRLFFLGFLSGMPDVELGLNDMWRQGKEVVGRHDIIPVATEEWIRLEAVEFHSCIQQEEYEKTRTIKFKPPDACYIELMRFRIRPPRNRELPLQLKAVMCITGNKVQLRADVLVPGFTSRKLGQIPCEDVMIRFPIPECWIYLFRVEKHFRYGSVKSAHRRSGKIKGIERFLGAVDTLEPSLMEVTSGQAKYEHQHRSIVWRMPRLPKEGQGAYTTHNLVCRMQLTSFDQIPDNLAEYAYIEFTMPATQASHTTVRSVSLCDSPSDNPPEKYVRQLARHEYRVGIEHVHTEETAAYEAATAVKPRVHETVAEVQAPAESDSDSSD